MKEELYCGSGEVFSTEEIREFVNMVFGFDGEERDFRTMFPHLYTERARIGAHNLVIAENGSLRAAVGVFPRVLAVGKERLKMVGIGNVAVHPDDRGKGYMKKLLGEALKTMIREGADLSDLGGQRQRYQYFGYDVGGCPPAFRFTPRTTDHLFRGTEPRPLEFYPLTEGAREDLWDQAYALYERKLCRVVRSREDFPMILRTHYRQPAAVLENGRFLGYFTGELGELTLKDPADLGEVVRKYVSERGEVVFPVGPWEKALLKEAADLCEEVMVQYRPKVNVFNYKKTVSAFLKLKASQEALADGEMTVLVHGFAGDEKLRIRVQSGVPAVEEAGAEAREDMVLPHLEAIRFFFGLYSPERERMPLARDWFPLPLAVERADHV